MNLMRCHCRNTANHLNTLKMIDSSNNGYAVSHEVSRFQKVSDLVNKAETFQGNYVKIFLEICHKNNSTVILSGPGC